VIFQPGDPGIQFDETGYLFGVVSGSQAEEAGLEVGEQLVAVNGKSFKFGAVLRLSSGDVPYKLTVVPRSARATMLDKTILVLIAPASLMGFLLLFGMIPFCRSHQSMGSEWKEDLLARFVSGPAAMVCTGSLACGVVAETLLDANGISIACDVTYAIYCFATMRCLVCILACPLLASELPESALARWRSENKGVWLIVTIVVLVPVIQLGVHCVQSANPLRVLRHSSYVFPNVLMDMILLEVLSLLSRLLGIVEHRIHQIQNVLPCKAADFLQQVHTPCAQLVNDIGPQLAPLGVPLLCIAINLLSECAQLYSVFKGLYDKSWLPTP